MGSRVVAAALVASALLYPASVAGASRVFTLSVYREGAADCPDGESLARAVEQQDGHVALSSTSDSNADVSVTIARRGSRYVAQIRTASGTREIADDGATCEGLAEALALTLNILLRPANEAPPAPASSEWKGSLEARARGGVTTVLAPVTALFELGVRFRPLRRLSVSASAFHALESSSSFARGAVDVSLSGGVVDGCVSAFGARGTMARAIEGGGCLRGALGAMKGAGRGFTVNRESALVWTAAGVEAFVGGPLLGAVDWDAAAGVWVAVGAAHFTVDGGGTAFAAPRMAPYGTLGLSVHIW